MRQTLDAKLLLLSVTYTWRIDTMPVYDFGIRFSYRAIGEKKARHLHSKRVLGGVRRLRAWKYMFWHAEGKQWWRTELEHDVLEVELGKDEHSINFTIRNEMVILAQGYSQTGSICNLCFLFSALFINFFERIWSIIKESVAQQLAYSGQTCSSFGSSQFHIPLCNVWVR